MGLTAGKGAGVTAQEWQVRGKFLTKRHLRLFSLETRTCAVFDGAAGLLQPWKDRSNAWASMPPKILMQGWNKGPGIWFPPPGRLAAQQILPRSSRPAAYRRYVIARLRLRMSWL
jgi:hypothetical protein